MASKPPKPLPRITDGSKQHSMLDKTASKKVMSELEKTLQRKEEEMLQFNAGLSGTESDIDDDQNSHMSETDYDSRHYFMNEIDLLLIGKTGNGKSALGNSILGHNAFDSKAALSSVTKDVTYDVSERNRFRIKVVDGPGVGDTRMDIKEATKDLLTAMSKAISLSPQGYHAFLLVVKFGGRFTVEDKETVDTLKKIFGEQFFKKYFILVMTCGDKFVEEIKIDFKQWVGEQTSEVFAELLKECNNRIVLFDNKTKDKTKMNTQVNELLKVIESLKKENCRYCDEHFNTAIMTRDSLLVQSEKEMIEDEIMIEANLILHRLNLILNSAKDHKNTSVLQELYERANVLYKKISDKDKGTGVLHTLTAHVWSIINSVRDQIKLSENILQEWKMLRKQREEQALKHSEERERDEFNKSYLDGRNQEKEKIDMLNKQIEQLKKTEDLWKSQQEEMKNKANKEWGIEKEKLQNAEKSFLTLKAKQIKVANEKISKSVFAKLRDKFSQKKKHHKHDQSEI